jgi:hypothetical protein
MTQKTLVVEVSVPQADGSTLPYGIMNADQAAELCDETFQKDVAHELVAADGPSNQPPVEAI